MSKYLSKNYDTQQRFNSYWQQVELVHKFNPKTVLVIGKGNGLVEEYLRKIISKIVTLDIDSDLNPDIVGDIRQLPFQQNEFDVVLCAEVLEHIPFSDVGTALHEIARVCRVGAVLSLPHWGWTFKVNIKIPFFGEFKRIFKLSGLKAHDTIGEHLWEIGKRGFDYRQIRKLIEHNFSIENDFLLYESPYHHFFSLKKK